MLPIRGFMRSSLLILYYFFYLTQERTLLDRWKNDRFKMLR